MTMASNQACSAQNFWTRLRLTSYIFVIISFLNFITVVRCQDNPLEDMSTTEAPKFLTRGGTFRAVIGESIVLPCQVENLGKYTLVWKRGNAVLSAGDMKITVDPRIYLVDGFSLEIRKVRIHDAGDYICQMSTLTPEDQIYTLEILVPPTVRADPPEDHLTFSKGDSVNLQCRGSGNPVPLITWTRKDNFLPNGENSVGGNVFTIPKIDRHQAGVYVCTANNGVGFPVSASIHVKVQFPPEIDIERSWVHSGDGFEAELACVVHAEPPPTVNWYLDSMLLHTTDRTLFDERGTRHSLIIRLVQGSDFGNYTCEADNKLGRARKYIELSGKPHRPVILSEPIGTSADSFNVSWSVQSFSPITEYRLLYRNGQSSQSVDQNQNHNAKMPSSEGEWIDVYLPPTEASDQNLAPGIPTTTMSPSGSLPKSVLHSRSYLIKSLEPDSYYQVQIVAKNKYGEARTAEAFVFHTSPKESHPLESSPQHVSADPEMSDLSVFSSADSTRSCLSIFFLLFFLLLAIIFANFV